MCLGNSFAQDFKEKQENYQRVKQAREISEKAIKRLFRDSGFAGAPRYIYWRSFKMDNTVELWAADSSHHKYRKVKTYVVCKSSGDLGPKRKQGDLQVPEGLYYLERYNPNSNYFLSMKISYPNESDLLLANKENPGDEIYIHGGCASIGCLPMTDSVMAEIYWVTVLAQDYQGKDVKIPFDIFPCRFSKKDWTYLNRNYSNRKDLLKFWDNIQEGVSFFEKHHIPPGYWVDANGGYHFLFPQNYHIHDPNH